MGLGCSDDRRQVNVNRFSFARYVMGAEGVEPPRAIRLLDLVQPENAESLGKAVVESANGRGKIIAEAVEQMNDGISEGGHDLGRGVFSYSAGVFAQSHVAAIVQAVLDVPVFARERL